MRYSKDSTSIFWNREKKSVTTVEFPDSYKLTNPFTLCPKGSPNFYNVRFLRPMGVAQDRSFARTNNFDGTSHHLKARGALILDIFVGRMK